MLARDLAFLNDYVQFGFMNHIIAALAIYQVGVHPDQAAAGVRELMEGIDPDAAKRMVDDLNDGARVQRVALARLYAELTASVEDLGALCHSIQYRDADGIFKRYVRSSTGQAAQFFDHVLACPEEDLGQILKIPSLDALQGTLPPDTYKPLEHHYRAFADALAKIAVMYRRIGVFDELTAGMALSPQAYDDEFHIILDVIDADGKEQGASAGAMARSYNKIKHRFTVMESLDVLIAALTPTMRIPYDHKSITPDAARVHLLDTVGVVRATGEVASLLIVLQEAGLVV